jgi:hypothetical protein
MRTLQAFSVVVVMLSLGAACSSAPDDVGTSAGALGQYDAVKITQIDHSLCKEVDCGLASAAMMRAVMTGSDGSSKSAWPCSNNSTCPTGKSLATALTMREYYNAIYLGTAFEDGHCGAGSAANGLAKTLRHVHSFQSALAGQIGDDGPDLSADCLTNPKACTGKGPMSQCEFERRLSRTGGSCNGTTFLGGYVAAVTGSTDNDPAGSPCYDGPKDHFIFVHDYDPSTDNFTVYDPACSGVRRGSWSSARLFRWANGKGDSISGFVYGRGLQNGESNTPPPPKCVQESDASFCTRLQKDCGSVTADDNCGVARTVDCGSCSAPATCGGSGQENVCGYGSYDDQADFPLAWWLTGTIRNDGLCARAHLASGEVRMTTCSKTDQNQNWKRTTSRQLENVGSGTCAQASTGTKPGVVSHRTCSTSSLQDWAMNSVEIVQGTTGYCLTIPYADYHDGAPVRYRACSDKDNQRFTYDLATQTISPVAAPDLCFDTGTSSGDDVKLRACDGSLSQRWNDARRGFVNRANTNLCLGVEGGPFADAPANAEVQTCTDSTDQMWGMRGRLQLHAYPTYCLQAAPSGDQMTTAACAGDAPLQKFTVWSQP